MIFYFSGTGNSKYAAEKIAELSGEVAFSLNDMIKNPPEFSGIDASGKLIFVVPTYAWRIPCIVEKWIQKTEFKNPGDTWFVMTCGGEIGNAEKYNKKLCAEKGFNYMGTAEIVMPENYIAMFNAPTAEDAKAIIDKAEPVIEKEALRIRDGKSFDKPRCNLYDRFMSSFVNPMFYSKYVKADAFRAEEACTGCGLCEKLCPLNNISLDGGLPKWGKDCTHCMACICHCPTEAIEYGNKSVGKPRYHID